MERHPDEAGPFDVCVLLTPRQPGGHEVALFGWLADAVRDFGLRPLIVATDPALIQACADAGLARWLQPVTARWPRLALLRALLGGPGARPLLLAPGVLHVDAWLLAAAVLRGCRLWVYVPMAHTAVRMGFSAGRWRDVLLAPWLRRVSAWITLDARQVSLLRAAWRVTAPVLALPNRARLPAPASPAPQTPRARDARLRVAYVGRFEAHQKGLDWLAATLLAHPAWARRCHWRFQGRGPAERLLRGIASALGDGHVEVHAHAPIDQALAACDVLLLCSRFEGLPLVALEATARGCPVVASRGSGLRTLLPAGSLFDFGDAAGLRQALDGLRSEGARRQAVAHAQARMAVLCDEARYRSALQRVVRALRGGNVEGLVPC